jgi:archaellum component FlaC
MNAHQPTDVVDDLRQMSGIDHVGQTAIRAAEEIERLRSVLREVRRDVEESADDVVWMRGGIETVVDRITEALGDHVTPDEAAT